MIQHPFLSSGTGIFSGDPYYTRAFNGVVSAEPAGYAPDGSIGVWKITYSDGTTQFEVPSQGFAGKGEHNWLPTAPEGHSVKKYVTELGDTGNGVDTPTTLIVDDPSKVQYESYMPEGMDSFGDFLKIAAPIALGALYAGGAFSGFGTGAGLTGDLMAGTSLYPTAGSTSIIGIGNTGSALTAAGGLAGMDEIGTLINSLEQVPPEVSSAFDQISEAIANGTMTKAEGIATMNEITSAAGISGASGLTIESAIDWAKKAFPNLSGDKLLQTAAQLVGNNMAHNAVEDTINRYADRLERLSPISADQRKQLGTIGVEQLGKDYLGPEFGGLMAAYKERGGQADEQYGRLAQLYDDPMSNPIMQAVSRITAENAARKSAAGRGLQAGSMPAEMQDALMASLAQNYGNIANPMNTTLSTLYQGQQIPMQAVNALSNAGSAAAQRGASAINAASGSQQALSNFMPKAFEYSIAADPTLRGNQTVFGNAGSSSAGNTLSNVGSAVKTASTAYDLGKKIGWF